MDDCVRTPIGTLSIDESGLLWHRLDSGVVVDVDAARQTVDAVRQITSGRAMPAVVDIRGVAFADKAARDGFAGDEHSSNELATALVVDKRFSKHLGNLFLRMSKPRRPVRMFTSEEEAAGWARTFLA